MRDRKHAEMIRAYIDRFALENYQTEVPYNYYGSRGFVDLVVIGKKVKLVEFKTRLDDIGEIIRQVKNQRTSLEAELANGFKAFAFTTAQKRASGSKRARREAMLDASARALISTHVRCACMQKEMKDRNIHTFLIRIIGT